jgi:hypothetical protein
MGMTHEFRPIDHGSHNVLWAPNALVKLASLKLLVGCSRGGQRGAVLQGAVGRHFENSLGLKLQRAPKPLR